MSNKTTSTPAEVMPVYQSAEKIYPREMAGRYATFSRWSTVVLLGLFYLVPWLQYDDRQAVLFDLPARKFYLLGLTLWPQDFPFLALLLIIAAISLFFFTALLGRVWCGFACPQTVWTEAFIWMEQWTEGTRSQRMKLDKAPMSWNKFRRKFSKQFLWITFSLWTGYTFVGYFTPIREYGVELVNFQVGGWALFWTLFYGFATYGNAGYMREQVCKYMCPYARFQSAMFDRDTLIISYDESRGEPRGSRKRGVDYQARGLGDCIDCTLCVQVCPTGIDIRDGLQYECIACGACVDACNSVMDKMNYPRGLVRYTTEHAVTGEKTRIIRPRVIVYASLLTILVGSLVTAVALRTPVILDVLRDRNALYRELPSDLIENTYTIKLINQSNETREFVLTVDGLPGLELAGIPETILVEGGGVKSIPVRARMPRSEIRGSREIAFKATATDNPDVSRVAESRFVGPIG
ncbi:MAG: cytochrome c oxidase accessory protein CcoG [Woeseiaceae bacterium]|jgi:cytochrome c oxidase accessory protein FixG|nr:cytochrome c oxidase accessory protein CcoG [Woeseiaceae bacterium]